MHRWGGVWHLGTCLNSFSEVYSLYWVMYRIFCRFIPNTRALCHVHSVHNVHRRGRRKILKTYARRHVVRETCTECTDLQKLMQKPITFALFDRLELLPPRTFWRTHDRTRSRNLPGPCSTILGAWSWQPLRNLYVMVQGPCMRICRSLLLGDEHRLWLLYRLPVSLSLFHPQRWYMILGESSLVRAESSSSLTNRHPPSRLITDDSS